MHGLLIVDKAAGWTSHDVVAKVRRLTGQRRIGHAGTLDPMATGVLVLCLGAATRLVEYMQGHDKRYRATIRLGEVTDTYDSDGRIVERRPVPPLTQNELLAHLQKFQGIFVQQPPAYSAIKVRGTPAHRRARRGERVAPPPRRVTVHELHLLEWSPPDLSLDIWCSAGTYVRSLAHDLGQSIGCGAHLIALRRTAVGPFTLKQAITLPQLEELIAAGRWQERVLPPVEAVRDMPRIELTSEDVRAVRFGQPIPGPVAGDQTLAAGLSPEGDLVAILRFQAERGLWQPHKVLT
ncbi:MAG: tRNA pseudouridine(55) synthase TruB [Anaerolineae bacterium]|nr:tRNA pseudouridine(55) synthase TruB [Anaerolineae bacterium]